MNPTFATRHARSGKTGILVSVRNAAEAQVALHVGVDVLDIKEPDNGSLGLADEHVVADILSIVDEVDTLSQTCISIALGELVDLDACDEAKARAVSAMARFAASVDQSLTEYWPLAFAKIGLSKMSLVNDWQNRWQRALSDFPDVIAPVAVVYADDDDANSPLPEEIVSRAADLGCRAILVDTFTKRRGNVFSHLHSDRLLAMREKADSHGMFTVLAGSINAECLEDVKSIAPQMVGVRGAVCADGVRTNAVCDDALFNFIDRLNRIAAV